MQLRKGVLAPYDAGATPTESLNIQYTRALDWLKLPPMRLVHPKQQSNFLMQSPNFFEYSVLPVQARIFLVASVCEGGGSFHSFLAIRGSVHAIYCDNPIEVPLSRPFFSIDSNSPHFNFGNMLHVYGYIAKAILGFWGCVSSAQAVVAFINSGHYYGHAENSSASATVQKHLGDCEVH